MHLKNWIFAENVRRVDFNEKKASVVVLGHDPISIATSWGIWSRSFEVGKEYIALHCPIEPHNFHYDCIEQWLDDYEKCPQWGSRATLDMIKGATFRRLCSMTDSPDRSTDVNMVNPRLFNDPFDHHKFVDEI